MGINQLWEHGKSQQYNLTYRGKMKKKVGRPKETAKHWKAMQIRESTYNALNKYQKEQSARVGIRISKVDIIDYAVKSIIQHKDFIKFAIDFNENNK